MATHVGAALSMEIKENSKYALSQFAKAGFPKLPSFVGRHRTPIRDKMQSYLPALGVDERTHGGVETTARTIIKLLEQYLMETAFLLKNALHWAISPFSVSGPSVSRPRFPLSV